MAGSTRDHHDPGLFFRWLGDVLNQIVVKVKVSDHVARPEVSDVTSLVCQQVKIGRIRVKSGRHEGKWRGIQERCRFCSVNRRWEKETEEISGGAKRGANRTIYCCSVHRTVYMCQEGKNTCWAEHLASVAATER